jgi:acyl-coenzyme A thioesterase 9
MVCTCLNVLRLRAAAWISETIVKTSLICHMEERNVYNKIFGGFLMRQALENAWIAVRQFACEYPVLVALDDLVFKHPVEVGSTLFISSTIVYRPPQSRHFVVRVTVEVSTIDHSTHLNKQLVTNTAYFVYAIPNARVELRQLYPETYAESMMYLDGKRHYEAVMNEHASAPSLAASRL